MLLKILKNLRGFSRDTRGNVSIEVAIFAPLMVFILAAAYVYYDAYRQKAANINAAYTISDALSRETAAVDANYMNGMHTLLEFLTRSDTQTGLRVTLVRYDADTAQYSVDWSEVRGPLYPLTTRDLNTTLVENLPTLLNNERVIVVETSAMYSPPINIPGITDQEMYNFAFTRPRFAPKLVWAGI